MNNWRKKVYITKKYFSRKVQRLGRSTNNLGLSWWSGFVLVIMVSLVILLGFDIYVATERAVQNYELLSQEQEKLAAIKEIHQSLNEELDYYSSLEYKQRYAYDSLGLAKPGEELYLIESGERISFELPKTNTDPIDQDNDRLWWDLVLTEMWKTSMAR